MRKLSPRKRLTIEEAPNRRGPCEIAMRYVVKLDGKEHSELYFNTRGYVGTLPTPEGRDLDIGEVSIAAYRREAARLNREFAAEFA